MNKRSFLKSLASLSLAPALLPLTQLFGNQSFIPEEKKKVRIISHEDVRFRFGAITLGGIASDRVAVNEKIGLKIGDRIKIPYVKEEYTVVIEGTGKEFSAYTIAAKSYTTN